MFKHNWMAIAQISDPYTRMALSLADEPALLARYARGFPDCIYEGTTNISPLCIPLSALMEIAWAHSKEDFPDNPEYWLEDKYFHLGPKRRGSHLTIPTTFEWGEGNETDIPDEILKQLIGQKAQAGLIVTYCNTRCLVTTINFDGSCPTIGSTFDEQSIAKMKIVGIYLVDVRFVALDK